MMDMEHHGMDMEHHGMVHPGMEGNPCMKMIWEKLDDPTKKKIKLRMFDEKIMHKENCIKQLQYKVETMKILRASMEKM
ncbi:hypothetical protein [Methanosphaerula palustris]|uniref:Uncharacterized protein n=1 Tax=Methanosphaerula palustris (strain ATCC BAA-1556 / DSM 19958 / E1-9c) TaxID=521011 RepID=B8GJ96_METPE|nr:hypothetical protein [Methanosphaerula palustris]ACL16937.1 hypothetical protein Mpal_1625 [Methanosphaerula palustris E1-9c]